jgi:hypothetical protein
MSRDILKNKNAIHPPFEKGGLLAFTNYKFHLPSQITVYPKEFDEGETSGFHLSQGWGDLKIRQPEQTWVQQTSDDPYSTTAHELGHELWEQLTPEEIGHHFWQQLTPEDRDRFTLALERWWKREVPQRIGKEIAEEKRALFPQKEETFQKKMFEKQEYVSAPTEAFARFTTYWTRGMTPPRGESEEAWGVFKSIMNKYNGNLRKRLGESRHKTWAGYVEAGTKPDFRSIDINLRGI